GGTTTAMTYTWTIGGTTYPNQTNSYTTASLSASAAYTVKVKNANNCESNTANGNITINFPGNNGQAVHATCGCATNTYPHNNICYAPAMTCNACKAYCTYRGYNRAEYPVTTSRYCGCFNYPTCRAYTFNVSNGNWVSTGGYGCEGWNSGGVCN
ncbi:MAG: hypothetical protein LBF81_05965, partial [Prevotellaceae bacterium]|nr:hypothetical protein [Prevotellaceae bacterium]